MRVLYDITFLGHSDRTGIFRVVQELARELAQSGECELQFCVSGSVSNHAHAREFISTSPELCQVPMLPLSRAQAVRARIIKLREPLCGDPRSIPVRALRRLLLLADCCIAYSGPSGEAQIYHSGRYAIPDAINGAPGVQKFLTVYDLLPIKYPEWFLNGAATWLRSVIESQGPDGWFFCPSESARNDLLNYRTDIDPKRVFVTPLAATDKFRPCVDSGEQERLRARLGLPEDAAYFLSLCRLEPRKNLAHIIRCFGRVLRETRLQNLYLVLAGGEGFMYGPIFEAIAADPLVREQTLLPGHVEDELLPALYSGATAFLYMSLYEGFGLPPLEAMKCGAPVITSNASSLPEVVGDAAITLDPADADGLCDAMLRVHGSVPFRAEMSRKSLLQARQFSWSRTAAEVLRGYRVALGKDAEPTTCESPARRAGSP